MPYMAQQWVTDAVRAGFHDRRDAPTRADETARVRAWLASLPLERAVIAAIDEPLAALEEGLRRAARREREAPAAG